MSINREGDSLYHYNHNHDRLGRFASSGGGGSLISKSVGYVNRLKAEKKRKEFLRAVQEGDAGTVYRNRKYLSNEDIRTATDRARAVNDLKSASDQRLLGSFKKFADITNYVNNSLNNMAGIGGTLSKLKKKEKHVSVGQKYANKFLSKHQNIKNLSELTLDDLEKATKQAKYLNDLDNYSRGNFQNGNNKKDKK